MPKAKIPAKFADQPELVNAVIGARQIQMDTEDDDEALDFLMRNYPMTVDSATKVIQDQTFRYVALYPEGHFGLEALRAENRVKSRRQTALRKIKPEVIERDDSRCQSCNRRVWGKDVSLDHKDPEGPTTLENVHLLCGSCNTIKGRRTWEEFLEDKIEWESGLKRTQNNRPNVICEQSGLSIKGRSWKESGCLSPDICKQESRCDNGYYERWSAMMDERSDLLVSAYDDSEFDVKMR